MSSQHNALKHGTDIQRAIARAVGLDFNEEGVGRISETLYPIFDVFDSDEWAFLRQARILGDSRQIAAGGAGTFGSCALENPVGSNYLIILPGGRSLGVQSGTAGTTYAVEMTQTSATAALGTRRSGVIRDSRWHDPASPLSSFQRSRATTAVGTPAALLGVTFGTIRVAVATELKFYDADVILSPGFAVNLFCNTANLLANFQINWLERPIKPGELPRV